MALLSNTLRTTLLLGALTGLLLAVAYLIAGPQALVPALVIAAVLNLGAYWFSDRAALALAGAREVGPEKAPMLYRIVDRIAARARLPRPGVAIVEAAAPNAFATGRDPAHAVVAVTTGLLDVLDEDELTAVLAHELGHVKNRDILVSSIAATLAGAVTALAEWLQWDFLFGHGPGEEGDEGSASPFGWLGVLLSILLAPLLAVVLQLAISRGREFGADDTGAELCGDPLALASALRKIEAYSQQVPLPVSAGAKHLFIIPPLTGNWLAALFSTHPDTEERIGRLRRMALRRGTLRRTFTRRWAW